MMRFPAARTLISLLVLSASAGSIALAAEPRPAAQPKAVAKPVSHPSETQVAEVAAPAPAPAANQEAPVDATAPSTPRPRAAKQTESATPARELVREGSRLVDEVGTFRLTGDRATFFYQEGRSQISALENLALERVARLVGETPDQLEWSVSGTVTEYRGNNYLVITRAVIKRKASHATASR